MRVPPEAKSKSKLLQATVGKFSWLSLSFVTTGGRDPGTYECDDLRIKPLHLVAQTGKLPGAVRLRLVFSGDFCKVRAVAEGFHLCQEQLELEVIPRGEQQFAP